MIRKLKFSNFCSFAEPAEINFTASSKLQTNNSFVTSKFGDQITTLAGVFGPNGAGKTTLLKALSFVNFFLIHSYKNLEADESIPLDTFATRTTKLSKFEIDFEGNSRRYRYKFSLKQGKIHDESLYLYDSDPKKFRRALHRKTTAAGNVSLESPSSEFDTSVIRKLLIERPNASMLAAGLVTGNSAYNKIAIALGNCVTNVGRSGKIDHVFENSIEEITETSAKFYKESEHTEDMVDLLKSVDLGISNFEIRKILGLNHENKAEELYIPFLTHNGPDGSFELTIFEESSGTKRLYLLFAGLLPVLKQGGIAIIDEMESDLHPHIIPVLLNLFSDPDINTQHAQLLFTCHHIEILNRLEKEQINLVDKSDRCVSEAFRLSDIKGVRREENFFANYNSGRYDAVPEPSLF